MPPFIEIHISFYFAHIVKTTMQNWENISNAPSWIWCGKFWWKEHRVYYSVQPAFLSIYLFAQGKRITKKIKLKEITAIPSPTGRQVVPSRTAWPKPRWVRSVLMLCHAPQPCPGRHVITTSTTKDMYVCRYVSSDYTEKTCFIHKQFSSSYCVLGPVLRSCRREYQEWQ